MVLDLVTICVTKEVPEDKVRHAAQVTAQYLDNNQAGGIDEKQLKSSLLKRRPVLLISLDDFNGIEFIVIEKGRHYRIDQD